MRLSFLSLLALLLIGLKLGSVIDWSWWWVLLPIYGIPAVLAGLSIILVMCGVTPEQVKRFCRK